MVHASRVVVALALFGLVAGPLYADVIPSQYAPKSDSKAKVEARLAELGLSPDAAQARAARLTDEEAAFFAADPNRVQVAGQEMWAGQTELLWWEWIFGAASLGGAIWAIAWFTRDGSS